MFKNATVYRIGAAWSAPLADVEAALQKNRFVACAATQPQSMGWSSRAASPTGRWSKRSAASGCCV